MVSVSVCMACHTQPCSGPLSMSSQSAHRDVDAWVHGVTRWPTIRQQRGRTCACARSIELSVPCMRHQQSCAAWQAAERQLLCGTSTLAFEGECPEHAPAVVMDAYEQIVQPFFARHAALLQGAADLELVALYRWALACVSAYSFELGDDKLQVWSSHQCLRFDPRLYATAYMFGGLYTQEQPLCPAGDGASVGCAQPHNRSRQRALAS
jgi:hypothetical protein